MIEVVGNGIAPRAPMWSLARSSREILEVTALALHQRLAFEEHVVNARLASAQR